MRYVMIVVPILFLAALVSLATFLYRDTTSQTGCIGAECEKLTPDEFTDKVIEARSQ